MSAEHPLKRRLYLNRFVGMKQKYGPYAAQFFVEQ
jgi:hypothetical protein